MSTKRKVVISTILGVLVLVIGFNTYINNVYHDVNSDIRMSGFIADWFVKFNDLQGLKTVANRQASMFNDVSIPSDRIIEEVFIPIANNKEMRVLILRDKELKPDAIGLLMLHGGGYAMGVPEQSLFLANTIMNGANTVVIIPEYTLSLEEPYPRALEDCYAALLWMKNNAEDLSINTDQLFVAGESAGGGLTAALTLYARDLNEVKIAFQMPLYPMLDATMSQPSAIDNSSFIWNSTRNTIAWELYLSGIDEGDPIPKYASPSQETNYYNLPPAYSYIGSLDPFKDELVEYMKKLRHHCVDVDYEIYEGGYHGFEVINPEAPLSERALRKLVIAYIDASRNYFAPQE